MSHEDNNKEKIDGHWSLIIIWFLLIYKHVLSPVLILKRKMEDVIRQNRIVIVYCSSGTTHSFYNDYKQKNEDN